MMLNEYIFFFFLLLCFSSKHVKTIQKDNSSPFLLEINGTNPIYRTIYDLLSNGVRGIVKKDVLLAIVTDILVSRNLFVHSKLNFKTFGDRNPKMNIVMYVVFLLLLQNMHQDLPSLVVDIIGIIDAETSNSVTDATHDERAAFCQIAKELEKFASVKLFKERLEMDTLQDVGTIRDKTFYTKFIKVKTKL